jgi:hypothetical protein
VNELPCDPSLPPGTLPADVSDREPNEDDEFWLLWWNRHGGTEPGDFVAVE